MKASITISVTLACAAGLLAGYAGRRFADRGLSVSAAPNTPAKNDTPHNNGPSRAGRGRGASPADTLPFMERSCDTLESLLASDDDSRFRRVAHWLLDASAPEIAAFWQAARTRPGMTVDLADMIFVNWTRLDPEAAISAVAGTGDEHRAWWAWSCHDPEAALAAALAVKSDCVNNIAWGIGEFHPEWLMKHFDRLPESARGNALSGLEKWDDAGDPLAVLDFLRQHGRGFNSRIFATLARRDPWAACDWYRRNGNGTGDLYDSYFSYNSRLGDANPGVILVKAIAESQPEALERIITLEPQGPFRRAMEAALFGQLVRTDPDAALQQAVATKAPQIAALRLSTLGVMETSRDPDKAFKIAGQLFKHGAGVMFDRTEVTTANGSNTSTGTNLEVEKFADALMDIDPARTMGLIPAPRGESGDPDGGYVRLLAKWADQDPDGYQNWAGTVSDPEVRSLTVQPLVRGLMTNGRFAEGMELVMETESLRGYLSNQFARWTEDDAAAARQWLESASLTGAERAKCESYLKRAE